MNIATNLHDELRSVLRMKLSPRAMRLRVADVWTRCAIEARRLRHRGCHDVARAVYQVEFAAAGKLDELCGGDDCACPEVTEHATHGRSA